MSGKFSSIPNAYVRSRVRRRFIKDTVICVGFDAVLIALTILTRSYSPGYLTLIAILCIAPFLCCHYIKWFRDGTFEGEIIEAKYREYMTLRSAGGGPGSGSVSIFEQDLKIRSPDGKIRLVKLDIRDYDKSGKYFAPIYAESDRVRHYYGTKFLQKLGEDKAPVCVFCGAQNLCGDTVCGACGAGLIDNTK